MYDFITKNNAKKFIREEVKKATNFYFRDLDILRKKLLKLEDEIKVLDKIYNIDERRLKKK